MFSGNHPIEPTITLVSSSSTSVVFTVEIAGMYSQDTIVNSEQFQRISILKNGNNPIAGYTRM
jgi:hypothetical protein